MLPDNELLVQLIPLFHEAGWVIRSRPEGGYVVYNPDGKEVFIPSSANMLDIHTIIFKVWQKTPAKSVCLCGSTDKARYAFPLARLRETLAGNMVDTIGVDLRSDADAFVDSPPAELDMIKARLDLLHLKKIDRSDEILVLNVGGYIGESTRREIEYARYQNKPIRYLEPVSSEDRTGQDEDK